MIWILVKNDDENIHWDFLTMTTCRRGIEN